jgi:rubredoxin
MENKIRCPKCSSDKLTANKKGFSGGKAVIGGLLTGGIGLTAGFIGSNKIQITCINCGHMFKPGQGISENELTDEEILSSNSSNQGCMYTMIGIFALIVFITILFL